MSVAAVIDQKAHNSQCRCSPQIHLPVSPRYARCLMRKSSLVMSTCREGCDACTKPTSSSSTHSTAPSVASAAATSEYTWVRAGFKLQSPVSQGDDCS
jgi:hypothetical protein